MKVRAFTLRMSSELGGFDDEELQRFSEDNDVSAVYEHMVHHQGEPCWAVLVTFRPRARPASPPPPEVSRDAEAAVPEADRALFEVLRRWRNERAKRDGRPTYVLFRNSQLADIARLRPSSVESLRGVSGVGDAKVREYGPELLEVIATFGSSDAVVPASPEPMQVPSNG